MKEQTRILEVFSSLQGEGIRLGERQIFVRFGGCNLCCDYCDEPRSIPLSSGQEWDQPRLRSEIEALERVRRHPTISWTGGEPLLQADFLREAMAWAKERGFSNYLETNGTLPAALKKVAELVDVVAMDIKLPSATGTQLWKAHEEFLRVAPERTFVKVVLTDSATQEEWITVLDMLRRLDHAPTVVLQPATTASSTRVENAVVRPIPSRRAVFFLRQARAQLKDVRLIPQWHPVWAMP